MKLKITYIITGLLMLAAMIISGCGGGTGSSVTEPSPSEPESYINVLSTETKSVLTVEEYFSVVDQSIFDFILKDSSKTYLIVTLWTKPLSNNITINMKDIVVVNDDSGRFSVVGYRTSGEYWDRVFTSGDARIKFGLGTLNMYDCVFNFEDSNAYSMSFEDYPLIKSEIGGIDFGIMGDNPSISFAFVISKASVNSGNLWLEVPNSPRVKLVVPKIETMPTTTPSPKITPTTTSGLSREHPVPMGESLITPEGYEITVLGAIKGKQAWNTIIDALSLNPSPDAGMQYIILTIKIKNISNQGGPNDYVNIFLNITDSSNDIYTAYDKAVYLPDGGCYYDPWEKLNIGSEATGRLSFQMPENENDPVLRWGFIGLAEMRFFEVKRE